MARNSGAIIAILAIVVVAALAAVYFMNQTSAAAPAPYTPAVPQPAPYTPSAPVPQPTPYTPPAPAPQPAPYVPPPPPAQNWKMTPNVAYYLGGLKREMIVQEIPNCNPDMGKQACGANASCKGFFHQARGGISGGGFYFPDKQCVLLNADLWAGEAGMSDSYYKS